MPCGYQHVDKDKRCQLYTLLRQRCTIVFIAKELEVNRSTIYREIKRNRGKNGYFYEEAQKSASKRKVFSRGKRKMHGKMLFIIKEKLNLQ